MREEVARILQENERRLEALHAPFNPITGLGSPLERFELRLSDFGAMEVQYLPTSMKDIPLIKRLSKAGSISQFLVERYGEETEENRKALIEVFLRLREKHDFFFWAAVQVFIKRKGGGSDVRFKLNHPQRKLVEAFERQRLAGAPIRLILLKARQWGGSTATQIYMAWLQLVHQVGLNSLIVGHVKAASTEVSNMFERLINAYPIERLYPIGASFKPNEPKLIGIGSERNVRRIPQRSCNIKLGTAEAPDSARGGDYNLVHCTEVGLWKTTEGKTPEQIIRSACSGVLYKPHTMIVYESTANGTGNFFQREYDAARRGDSQFKALFVAWFEIEQYSLDIPDREAFATELWRNRKADYAASDRAEPGKYLWWLWEQGATLEAIHWYIQERKSKSDHGDMASEFPSDDIEAFVHSGQRVFDMYQVEALRHTCKPPRFVGDVVARGATGEDAITDVRFVEDHQGLFTIWEKPEIDPGERITNRYLVVVDIGGRSRGADYSVICVFDRLFMMEGGKPVVVAQWYGHIDMDKLAWKSAQIAKYYDDALLVIESNTLETKDPNRQVDGDHSHFILNQIKDVYDNLYARPQSADEIRDSVPRKYGFHTNVHTKPIIIDVLITFIREGLYVERDERCLNEYITYERKQNGAYGAIIGKHDDLLMTRAIGLYISSNTKEMPLPKIIQVKTAEQRRAASRRSKPVSEATI